jgi:hypothetical protein
MAAIANITVYDGAATPVAHTLNAISVTALPDGGVLAYYRESLASTPAYANISLSLKMQTLKNGVIRCEALLEVPVMESVSGQNAQGYTAAPKVAYVDRFSAVEHCSQRSTVTDRRIAKQMITNLMNNISTSVAAATSGPVPDLFDSLVAPT